jgi:hypothetical protein
MGALLVVGAFIVDLGLRVATIGTFTRTWSLRAGIGRH